MVIGDDLSEKFYLLCFKCDFFLTKRDFRSRMDFSATHMGI